MAWHARPGLQPSFVDAQLRAYLEGLALPSSTALKLDNRIAFVGSAELAAELEHFAVVEAVVPAGECAPADLLLIGGDWPRAGEAWREALLNVSPAQTDRLRETIALYRSRGTPSVLWLTGEAEAAEAMLHLADAVDAVFVPRGVAGAATLEAGVDVKVFNPFRGDMRAFEADAAHFRFVIDGAHALSQLDATGEAITALHPLLAFGSWLIDSSYRYQIPNMRLPAIWRRRFIGHVEAAQRSALMKMAYGVFLPSALGESRPAHSAKRAWEAAACKALVLDESEISDAALAQIVKDDVARAGRAHLAWREVLTHHTLFERLETIFAAVRVAPAYTAPSRPFVNVVMPTVRPDLIPFALAMFRRQTYGNVRLSIVANGVRVPDEVERLIQDSENVALHFVPQDKTIGYCMNYGIDQAPSDYWAKWDDDDIYGPHYLEDQMLQRKYADFDVAGKAAIFNYVEERDVVYARNFGTRDAYAHHLGGGTLLARNGLGYFAEDGRGGEDRAFLTLARERGARLLAGDPFNFVQVRRADAEGHTWTLGPGAMDLRGPRRVGLRFEGVLR